MLVRYRTPQQRSLHRMASSKVPISRLPLPQSSSILTHNLTPDPAAPSATALRQKIKTQPSSLRRSQASHASAHFSYTTPLPIPFPYRIAPPPAGLSNEERSTYVEKVLASQEPLIEAPSAQHAAPEGSLKKFHSVEREKYERELLSLAPTCLKDCLPSLDVGDAFNVLGSGSLSAEAFSAESASGDSASIRKELVDILSGEAALMSLPENPEDGRGYAPWSLRYSGHQFGSWAGQLGDGRAISIREFRLLNVDVASNLIYHSVEVPHPSSPDVTYELQLKGAGRTPFSRGADGLAVLRSSVREYLCAEGQPNGTHPPFVCSKA